MCGVFGVICDAPIDPAVLSAADKIQHHRGPDASNTQTLQVGSWHVGLVHHRLAIIDLSPAGIQPMPSPTGRSLIAFNGEIYNYLELRGELEARGVVFRTRTDTEVIAAACEEYGIAEALSRMNGMWAFVWLDLANSQIYIARDRFGVKPMYLCERGRSVAFGSEIKTLLRSMRLRCKVHLPAVATYLRALQQDNDERTFFEGIVKLPAGHYAQLDASRPDLKLQIRRYWSLELTQGSPIGLDQAIERTRELLDDAIRLRLRSDVPIGLLLSGGLDSSAIAAFASERMPADGHFTFISAVSDDPRTDESLFIRTVARHLKRTVHEVRLQFTAPEILPLIARTTEQCDEPVGSFSCVAQNLLMHKAREAGVTVLMSGQGSDEVFCGYRKYAGFQLQALARAGRWGSALRMTADSIRERTGLTQFSLADARRYMPAWLAPQVPDVGGPALVDVSLSCPPLGGRADVRERQKVDIESLSIPALTHWEDRNSMAWGREVRNPFLDYRLVSFGVNLPMEFKLSRGWTKYVLRRAIQGKLPDTIVWRRDKRGFSTPEGRMLRNELREPVRELLSPQAQMVRRGLIDSRKALARFEAFLGSNGAAQGIASRDIFQLLSLELWLRAYADNLE